MKHFFPLFLLFFLSMPASFAQNGINGPVVRRPVYFDVSPPLRDMMKYLPARYDGSWKDGVVKNYFAPDDGKNQDSPWLSDSTMQRVMGDLPSDTTIVNFDGNGNIGGYVPPDTHGEVGLNHYFQVVNTSYSIFNKSGFRIFGPFGNSTIWAGMPNNSNDGDAIVHYDEQADRWFFSQFSLPNGSSTPPFFVMIAVSQTPDPTGSWYRYQYEYTSMPDYPKFGIWPDGYYMSTNNFLGGWIGNGVSCFDRAAMLSGDPDAAEVAFIVPPGGDGFSSLLPADCDGTFPDYGTPNYFTFIKTNPTQKLGIYEFHVDWNNPAASTFGNKIYLNVNPFGTIGSWGNGIPQLGTDKKLDPLSDRLMYRQQYRRFNGYGSVVINHTVDAGAGVAGIRWYELRNTGTGWNIYQQSTYAPSDGHSRWMGSIAQDTAGTIAVGYSISSSSIYPGIRYTGRLKGDPLNQMTMTEKTIIHGGGSQTGIWSGRCRWGDYSAISVDPSAPTTFWYTTEYYATSSSSGWQTRIASFTFGNVFSSAASATPALLCSSDPDSVQLDAYAYGGSGSFTYSWTSIPAGFTSTQKNPKVKPAESTKYIVAISDGTQTRHDTATVRLVGAATAFAGNDTIVCWYISPIPMNASATNYSKVAWGTTGDGYFTHPTSVNTEYIPGIKDKTSGSVIVKLMVVPLAPCSGNKTSAKVITLDPCTGIETPAERNISLLMQPNPANDMVEFTLNDCREQCTLAIISAEGSVVFSGTLMPQHDSRATLKTDVSGLKRGLYLVKVTSGSQSITRKLILR